MSALSDKEIKNLEKKASEIRQSIIEMLVEAKSGHTAGALGMADIFALLYFHALNHTPENSHDSNRDRLVLSNGHICPVYYATLAHRGFIPKEELMTLRKFGSRLQGHPHRDFLDILETSSGPLGSGLSQAVGMALAARMDKNPARIFALMSDGEQEAGMTWEAGMLAGKEKLNNLVAIIDRNNIQIDGFTEDVMPLEPLADKWRAWNWHVLEVDGHNFEEINNALEEAKSIHNRPTMIIAHTTPGKGVKEFENKYEWHGKPPTKEEGEIALAELRKHD
ncbi:MAG TPA: transketolase [Candidatus Paceibacterota bacterium]